MQHPASRPAADLTRNSHVHPAFAAALNTVTQRPPLKVERITWYSTEDTRHARGNGRLLLQTRDGVREGFIDGAGTWRLADGTVAGDVLAWADTPDGVR